MSGHRNVRELRKGRSPERVARTRARVEAAVAEMPLQELRLARELSQQEMAELLEVGQPEVSKMERRTDLYVSTLRRFVQAMGGELEIQARFPDGIITINQFREIEQTA